MEDDLVHAAREGALVVPDVVKEGLLVVARVELAVTARTVVAVVLLGVPGLGPLGCGLHGVDLATHGMDSARLQAVEVHVVVAKERLGLGDVRIESRLGDLHVLAVGGLVAQGHAVLGGPLGDGLHVVGLVELGQQLAPVVEHLAGVLVEGELGHGLAHVVAGGAPVAVLPVAALVIDRGQVRGHVVAEARLEGVLDAVGPVCLRLELERVDEEAADALPRVAVVRDEVLVPVVGEGVRRRAREVVELDVAVLGVARWVLVPGVHQVGAVLLGREGDGLGVVAGDGCEVERLGAVPQQRLAVCVVAGDGHAHELHGAVHGRRVVDGLLVGGQLDGRLLAGLALHVHVRAVHLHLGALRGVVRVGDAGERKRPRRGHSEVDSEVVLPRDLEDVLGDGLPLVAAPVELALAVTAGGGHGHDLGAAEAGLDHGLDLVLDLVFVHLRAGHPPARERAVAHVGLGEAPQQLVGADGCRRGSEALLHDRRRSLRRRRLSSGTTLRIGRLLAAGRERQDERRRGERRPYGSPSHVPFLPLSSSGSGRYVALISQMRTFSRHSVRYLLEYERDVRYTRSQELP